MADEEEFVALTRSVEEEEDTPSLSSTTSSSFKSSSSHRPVLPTTTPTVASALASATTAAAREKGVASASSSSSSWFRIKQILALALFIVLIVYLYHHELTTPNRLHPSMTKGPSKSATTTSSSSSSNTDSFGTNIMVCPSQLNEARNDQTLKWYKDNIQVQNNTSTTTWTDEQVEKLKNEKIDGWKRTYHQLKAFKKDWKIRHFTSLQSGDSIFESACGKGINLLFTLELLKENLGIENLNVYGIEYREDAAVIANGMLRRALPGIGSQLGSICQADATNLSFIPSESFDLSYTGYIEPLEDPLNIAEELGRELKFEDLCDNDKNLDWARKKLRKLDQSAQEDWYAAWVKELVRITKRGKPIVIEEISLPMCEDEYDWGGVKREWWKEAAIKYKWDIDVESIYMEGLKKSKEDSRYNLFMRKNK